jgi:hypothetical protein
MSIRTRTKDEQPVVVTPTALQARTANRITPNTGLFHAYGSYYTQSWNPGAKITESGWSKIIDDTSPSRVTKGVTHFKKSFKRANWSNQEEYAIAGTSQKQNFVGSYAHNYSWGWYGDVDPFGSIPPVTVSFPKTANQLLVQAMSSFRSINQTDNLLNLVEASQLKQGVGNVFDILRRFKKKGRSKSGVIRASDFSNQYLFYSFGLAPLISDIQKINRGIKTLKSDLDRLIRDYNKPSSAIARCSGSLVKNPLFSASGYSIDGNTGWWHLSPSQTGPITRLVGVKGRRNVEYQSDAFKKLHYVISRYVATGPASFAWERIPFSFVFDWFVDLSSIITAIDNALTGFSQSIDDCWVSEKWSYLSPVTFHGVTSGWATNCEGQQQALMTASYYNRSYLTPTIQPVLSDRFGKKQASLLAALLHQYVANLRR